MSKRVYEEQVQNDGKRSCGDEDDSDLAVKLANTIGLMCDSNRTQKSWIRSPIPIKEIDGVQQLYPYIQLNYDGKRDLESVKFNIEATFKCDTESLEDPTLYSTSKKDTKNQEILPMPSC